MTSGFLSLSKFSLQVWYSDALDESFASSRTFEQTLHNSVSSSGVPAKTDGRNRLTYRRQRDECWQISSLSGERVRYSHQRDFELLCKNLQEIKAIARSLLIMHKVEERLKINGLEGQLVEDFGKVGQTVPIETGLSKGVHSCFRETSGEWQLPVQTERHCLKKWKQVHSNSSCQYFYNSQR